MASTIELHGYRVLILGASSGIGAAVARLLARCGASICIHYNSNKTGAEEVARGIVAAGGSAHVIGADLSVAGAAGSVVHEASQHLGGLDVLINNAGSLVGRTSMADFDDTLYQTVFDLNTRAVLEATKAAYPHLAKSRHASIINVGSIAGRNGGGLGSGVYSAAKAAVHSLTRSMASEFAKDGIRVNAVAPGFILTPFHAKTPDDRKEATRLSIPMGRLGKAEDCAWAFAFLSSIEMSGYITGQIIDINGGQLMP